MSDNLTTEQIVSLVEGGGVCPPQWHDWEYVIGEAVQSASAEDAADAARFLEKLDPGRTWSAAEYHGLMTNHFTSRWESAAHIGHIRADEKFQDALVRYKDNEHAIENTKKQFAERTASDEAAAKYIRSRVGTHVFDCADGTVLTFDGIFGGIIDGEEPY